MIMENQQQGKPNTGTTTGDVTIKQLAQWMQKQQNKIDDELKEVHTKLTELDKTSALTDYKIGEINTNLASFKSETKADLKELKDSILSLKTTVAWAGGVVATIIFIVGVVLTLLRFIPK